MDNALMSQIFLEKGDFFLAIGKQEMGNELKTT